MEVKRKKRIKKFVIERDGSLCCFCEKVLSLQEVTLDHIVPESKGGTFNTTNLTVSCAHCNSLRGNVSFFEYCKKFNFSEDKVQKYKKLCADNLKIKVLNIAKEKILNNDRAIPQVLIKNACKYLKIKILNFENYENEYSFDINFRELCDRKRIKCCFELLIRIIEADTN